MKKFKIRYVVFGVLAVILICVGYLFIHNPGIPINTWTPVESFSVQDEQKSIIDSSQVHTLDIAPYKNPETIQLHDGKLYAAVDGGSIISLKEDGTELTEVLHTGGYILEFDFDDAGNLYFCDCNYEGEPAVCKYDGNVIERLPIRDLTYPDAICIDNVRHTLYFSNATCISPAKVRHTPQEVYMMDMMAHTNTGSVISYNLISGDQRTITDGMSFANGLQLTADDKNLLINETSENKILKVELASGKQETLLTIPGYPDNLHKVDNGYWTGFAGAYAASYDDLSNQPLLRRVILNLPVSLLSSFSGDTKGADVVYIKYTDDGTVKEYHSIEDMGFYTTGVIETDKRLYFETISGIDKIYYYNKDLA